VSKTLRLNFCDTFVAHLLIHQFGVTVKGGRGEGGGKGGGGKAMVHNVQIVLDIYHD